MSFNIDDKVVVTAEIGNSKGKQGVITKIFESGGMLVLLEDGKISGFFESELEIADPKREALIRLAETLDSARKQAKAIDDTDDMDGNPRLIQTAMENALMDLTAFNQTGQVLDLIVNEGLSVREALKKVEK